MTKISVVIPSNHCHHELVPVVYAICNQTVKPHEIVIVDSSSECGACPAEIFELCLVNGLRLIYEHRGHALPGQARNIGLGMSNSELIAFLDVQTIPRSNWIESSVQMLSRSGVAGIWGATCFSADTTFEKLVRDGFYGTLPRRTLPGSVFSREVFAKVGLFVDWTRAGEDTEWMLRLELLKVSVASPLSASIDYVGLHGTGLRILLSKWYRNYTASCDLPHFFPQRLLLWLVLYPLVILIASNWNYLIADWHTDSPLYIGHVTKIVAVLPVLAYVAVRGLVLPIQRGVGFWRLFPIRFVMIMFICSMADLVKVLVFSIPKRKQDSCSLDIHS
jgi:hypothetical protein